MPNVSDKMYKIGLGKSLAIGIGGFRSGIGSIAIIIYL